MGDLDPASQAQQYTPKQTDLVDVFAETKRVTDAMLRANPLRDAVIDDGLIRWRGNYGGDLLQIGELSPDDPVFGGPQRGFSLVRDDPDGESAIALYDAYVGDRPSGPLIQQLHMRGHDGRPFLLESQHGGLIYPREYIGLNGMVNDVENSPTRWIRTSHMGARSGEERRLFFGAGNMTGSRLAFFSTCTSNGPTYEYWLELSWENGDSFTSGRHVSGGASFFDTEFDFTSFPKRRGGWVRVEVWGTNDSSDNDNSWTWIYPEQCYSFSRV